MRKLAALICAALAAGSQAFFDGFEGSSLGSHWDFFSEGSSWSHTVSGGQLIVSNMSGPFEFDEVGIVARVNAPDTLLAHIRVMWDAGAYQTFSFGVAEEFPFMNPRIGSIRYDARPGSAAVISGFAAPNGTGTLGMPETAPGVWHDFILARTGTTLTAQVDGNNFVQVNPGAADPVGYLFLHFGGPETSEFGEIRVDFASFVPEPSSLAALGAGAAALARRRLRLKKSAQT